MIDQGRGKAMKPRTAGGRVRFLVRQATKVDPMVALRHE
jgi:hypothetical protein